MYTIQNEADNGLIHTIAQYPWPRQALLTQEVANSLIQRTVLQIGRWSTISGEITDGCEFVTSISDDKTETCSK